MLTYYEFLGNLSELVRLLVGRIGSAKLIQLACLSRQI